MALLLFSVLVSNLNTAIERRPVLLCSVHLKQFHDESALLIRSRSNATSNPTKYSVFLNTCQNDQFKLVKHKVLGQQRHSSWRIPSLHPYIVGDFTDECECNYLNEVENGS